MDIKEYNLKIETEHQIIILIYRGNENIIIREYNIENEKEITMLVPRYIMQKFLEIIE